MADKNQEAARDAVQEKPIGLKASLDGCDHAFDPEQSRNYDQEEPCSDSVH